MCVNNIKHSNHACAELDFKIMSYCLEGVLTWYSVDNHWTGLYHVTDGGGSSVAITPRWVGHPTRLPRPLRLFGNQRFRPSSLYTLLYVPVCKPVAAIRRRPARSYLSYANDWNRRYQQCYRTREWDDRQRLIHRLSDASEWSSM